MILLANIVLTADGILHNNNAMGRRQLFLVVDLNDVSVIPC